MDTITGSDVLPENWDIMCNYNFTEYKAIFGHVSRENKKRDPVEITRKGVTWYVSDDGSDTNSGKSPEDAFLTGGVAIRAAIMVQLSV